MSVRRLANFVEQSLTESLTWTAFEPNDSALWSSIVAEITPFMTNLSASGAFASPDFTVNCDANTTTQTDMLNGVVNLSVDFAPTNPAEFVVLNVQVGAVVATAAPAVPR